MKGKDFNKIINILKVILNSLYWIEITLAIILVILVTNTIIKCI